MNKILKSIKIIIIFLFSFLILSCELNQQQKKQEEVEDIEEVQDEENEEQEEQEPANHDSEELEEEKEEPADPEEIIEPTIKKVSDVTLSEIPECIAIRLSEMTDYDAHTVGSTVAKLFITYTQSIDSTISKYDNAFYIHTVSNSTLVKVYHEAFINEENVIFKTKQDNEFTKLSYTEYTQKYGNDLYSINIEGFVIDSSSIKSIEDLSTDDEYIYKMEIDGNKCGDNNKIQMKEYGGLSNYPTYESVSMIIHILEDFTITKIEFEAKYTAPYPLLGSAKCTQKYVVTYSSISEENKEIIKNNNKQ